MKDVRAFTLVELLVVITIIGIIASIVLPALRDTREKGVDALVRSNFSSLSAQAEIIYEESGSYSAVCSDAVIQESLEVAAEKSTGSATSYSCHDEAEEWAAAVVLRELNQVNGSSGEDYWCIDFRRKAQLIDSDLATTSTVCS